MTNLKIQDLPTKSSNNVFSKYTPKPYLLTKSAGIVAPQHASHVTAITAMHVPCIHLFLYSPEP